MPINEEPDEICWICLDDCGSRESLMSPCQCPRKVHHQCLARWQLQQAGKAEEKQCRFCQSPLADWKASLTPEPLKQQVNNAHPVMVVYFEGVVHRIQVKPGDAGLQEFTERIRQLFRLEDDVDISLTFGCKEPMSGQHLKLEGVGAFDAAVHCASVAAAERAVRSAKPAELDAPCLNDPPPALSRFSAADIIQNSPNNDVSLLRSSSSRGPNPVRHHYSPSDPLPGNPLAGSSPFASLSAILPGLASDFDPATYATTMSTPRTSSSSSRDISGAVQRMQRQPSPLPTIYSECDPIISPESRDSGSTTPTAEIEVGAVDAPCAEVPTQRGLRRLRRSSGIEDAPLSHDTDRPRIAPQVSCRTSSTTISSIRSSISTLGRKIKRSLLGGARG